MLCSHSTHLEPSDDWKWIAFRLAEHHQISASLCCNVMADIHIGFNYLRWL